MEEWIEWKCEKSPHPSTVIKDPSLRQTDIGEGQALEECMEWKYQVWHSIVTRLGTTKLDSPKDIFYSISCRALKGQQLAGDSYKQNRVFSYFLVFCA